MVRGLWVELWQGCVDGREWISTWTMSGCAQLV